MSWVAAAVVGGSVVNGVIAGNAADSAADAQTRSTQMGIDQQNKQFDSVQRLLNPYVQASTGTGIYTPVSVNDLVDTSGSSWRPNQTLYANSPEYRASWDKFIAVHNAKYGMDPGGKTSDLAATQQYLQSQGFNLDSYNQKQSALPQARGSLFAQQDLLGLNGIDAQQTAINGISNSPMFAEMQKQGENAILQNASATGGLRGGNTQGALAQFRPQLLSQLIDQQYQRLGGLTTMGQNSAAGVGAAGLQTGNQISGLLQHQGAAQAGAALASGRANVQMVNGLASGFGQYVGSGGFGGSTAPQINPSNEIF